MSDMWQKNLKFRQDDLIETCPHCNQLVSKVSAKYVKHKLFLYSIISEHFRKCLLASAMFIWCSAHLWFLAKELFPPEIYVLDS